MDKLYEFEIILRGDAKDRAPSVVVKYQDHRGYQQVKKLESLDLTKIIFLNGEAGEFWYDAFAEIEIAEGIE